MRRAHPPPPPTAAFHAASPRTASRASEPTFCRGQTVAGGDSDRSANRDGHRAPGAAQPRVLPSCFLPTPKPHPARLPTPETRSEGAPRAPRPRPARLSGGGGPAQLSSCPPACRSHPRPLLQTASPRAGAGSPPDPPFPLQRPPKYVYSANGLPRQGPSAPTGPGASFLPGEPPPPAA